MALLLVTTCLIISGLPCLHASNDACTSIHINIRSIQDFDDKKVFEIPLWTSNLPKAKCLKKCHLDSQCVSVNLSPETETCIGFDRHFEGLVAQTEAVQGYKLFEMTPSFLCTTNEYCLTNFGSSHCYEDRCRCDIGYGLDGVTCRMLTECVSFSDKYNIYPGFGKWGNGYTTYSGQTLLSCGDICINQTSCETANFNPNSGNCWIDVNNWFDVTEQERNTSPIFIYIQRECNW